MHHTEISVRLRDAFERSGQTAWELSRRANVKEPLVDAVLVGSRMAPVEAVCRLAWALEMDLVVIATVPTKRVAGPVNTVVDLALEKLELSRPSHDDAGSNRTVDKARTFIASEREALDRLHAFLDTAAFDAMARRLVELGCTGFDGEWLAEWLMRPAVEMGGRPIDMLHQPDGGSLVSARLEQIAMNVLA